MFENIDLDINNYTITDIEKIFNLSLNNYNTQDILTNYNHIINQALSSDIINKQLIIFINLLYNKITIYNSNANELLNTSKINNLSAHPIINSTEPEISNTYKYKYIKGSVNPVERQIIKKTLCINTLFRENYKNTTSTDFSYILPENIENVINMKLSSIEMLNAFYEFSTKKKNNIFTINTYNIFYLNNPSTNPNQSDIITIQDGSYTTSQIITYINNYFNKKIPNGADISGLDLLIYDINNITGKSVIRARDASDNIGAINPKPAPFDNTNAYYSPNFYFDIIFYTQPDEILNQHHCPQQNIPKPPNCPIPIVVGSNKLYDPSFIYKTCAGMLGFTEYKYTTINALSTYTDNSTDIIYKAYLSGEMIYGNIIYNYIYIDIDDFQRNFAPNSIIAYNINKSYLSTNILAKIQILSGQFTNIFDTGNTIFKQREYFGPVCIKRLHIKLLDQYGCIIDLNNCNYSFSFEFQQLYYMNYIK